MVWKIILWDFPGDPVFKTPHFQDRVMSSVPVRDLWSHMPLGVAKKYKNKNKKGIMPYFTADALLDLMEISVFHEQNPAY